MAVSVIVPLHSDLTQFDADEVWSEELEAAVHALSQALGERLGDAASAHWPELLQLYVDCSMLDSTDLSTRTPRFEKKSGQFNIACDVDCRPLVGVAPAVQAAAIFDVVCQAADAAFAKRKVPALAQVSSEFRTRLDEAFVDDCLARWPAPEDDGAMDFEPIPLDAQGRLRHVRELEADAGELWLMARPHQREIDFAEVMATIEAFVEDGELGEASGSSVGQGSFDLSFEVDDLQATGLALEKFLRKQLPWLDFLISDDYETALDEAEDD
jgi:hypothetical protein